MIETSAFKLHAIKHNFDATMLYDIELTDYVTVTQFMQSITSIDKMLHGTIAIKAYVPNNMPGKLLSIFDYKTNQAFMKTIYDNKVIIEAKAHGGYSLLNFTLKIKI